MEVHMTRRHTKSAIAARYGVTPRTVENWWKRGLLPPPLKLGNAVQSRVRWADEDLDTLERNLAALTQEKRAA